MRLLVVSNTSHYYRDEEIVGWGPTLIELDQTSALFSGITHIAELFDGPAPEVSRAYETPIETVLLPARGGTTLGAKLGVLLRVPRFLWVFLRELARADAVHLRCPGSLGLIAMLVLPFTRGRPRWIKFAGNWRPETPDARSYRFQRWFLEKPWARAVVTVNGDWPGQPDHVRAFLNPCLTTEELSAGQKSLVNKPGLEPLRLIFVGSLHGGKGELRATEIAARLVDRGVPVALDFVGDGKQRPALEERIAALGIGDQTTLHGWVDRRQLPALYGSSHVILLPSGSEGWPKVLSEAMAYGVVPVSSAVSSIPQYLERFRCGRALPVDDLEAFADALATYASHPELWRQEAERAIEAAADFSFDAHLERLRPIFYPDR